MIGLPRYGSNGARALCIPRLEAEKVVPSKGCPSLMCTSCMKKKGKKRKKQVPNRPRTLRAGWGTFFVLGAVLCVIIWFVLNPFLSSEAHVLARFAIVLGAATVLSAVATYILNSVLTTWSKRKRRRT